MEANDVIACVSCGSPLGIGECSAGGDVACGSCGAVHQIECQPDEEGADEVFRQDESDWTPEEDAARVFGKSGGEAESEPAADKVTETTTEVAPAGRRSPERLRRVVLATLIVALGAAGAWEWRQHQFRERALLARLTFLEERLMATGRKMSRSGDQADSLGWLQTSVAELDDGFSRMASHVRLQSANSLQMDQSLQSARDLLVRHERDMGKLTLKVALLEREMADKSRHAREAFELAQKKRRAADRAAVPMRNRIASLESKRDRLLERYRALSVPRRPQGVVSTRRATAIMKEWEAQVAPALDQLQSEIASIGSAIRQEQLKIDELYVDSDAGEDE